MIRTALALALFASVALTGCSADREAAAYDAPKPLDKMSNEEWCAYYAKFLANPQLSPKNREIDLQRMRARGCAMPS